jgi:protein-S-isoprenylcysteine O-methyltransferase Ste14
MKETAYLFQTTLIIGWWIGLASSDHFFVAFQFPEIGAIAFWSFVAPDIVVIALLSLIRVYKASRALELIVLGGFSYGTLYCICASCLTGGGYLSSTLMTVGVSFNLLICFDKQLFRTSSANSVFFNGFKTLVQLICIWAIALVIIPGVIMDAFGQIEFPKLSVNTLLGIGLFVLCSTLGFSSAMTMVMRGNGTPLPLDQTSRLVTSGPYRFVRNPMAIAGIGQGLSISLIFLSPPILVYSILGAISWNWIVRSIEERDMMSRFGEAYRDYQENVDCWIPAFRQPKEND